MYSDTLLDHFESPRNVGSIEGPDADAEDENPVCGDRLHLWLRIEGGLIRRASWKAEGCAPAIAAASMLSEMVTGLPIEEARRLDREALSEALGGLPARKAHAALLCISVLREALDQYTGGAASPPPAP
jgi:nitrogen fixation NifU-like protein